MAKPVKELDNFELVDEFEKTVKYWQYDPVCNGYSPDYELDELRDEIKIRMNLMNDLIAKHIRKE